jgi:hypothetical protein
MSGVALPEQRLARLQRAVKRPVGFKQFDPVQNIAHANGGSLAVGVDV